MRTITITNQKGGSGKTTTVVNLAAALVERNRGILIIDLDSQASATAWLGIQTPGKGIAAFFDGTASLDSLVISDISARLDIIPGSAWLTGIDKTLAGEVAPESMLKRGLEAFRGRYDYILIDCPPSLGILTVNALAASGEVLIPVEVSILAFSGLVQLMHTVQVVRERLNPDLVIAGILACRVDARTRNALDIVELLREKYGRDVFKTVIRENVRTREAPSWGKPITEYDSNSAGAADYRALAAEIIRQEKYR